jgi:hypothetical protein
MGYGMVGADSAGDDVPSSPDYVIVGNGPNLCGQMVDNASGLGPTPEPPTPEPPTPATAPQIGPFPVPPSVAAAWTTAAGRR